MKRRALLVFPHNFCELRSGTHRRIFELVRYLKVRGFAVDQVALSSLESSWDVESVAKARRVVDDLYLFGASGETHEASASRFLRGAARAIRVASRILNRRTQSSDQIPDASSSEMCSVVAEVVKRTKYDFAIFGYVYFRRLFSAINPFVGTKVILVEDFISKQIWDLGSGAMNLGGVIGSEISAMNEYDEAIFISQSEFNFFQLFLDHPKMHLIPFFLDRPRSHKEVEAQFELMFIGFSNPHNATGLRWFLDQVLPLLDPSVRILVLGSVVDTIIDSSQDKRLQLIRYAEDLEQVYTHVKLTICPLFTGSGLKVKIIESIAHGIPVVCTNYSIIGFPRLFESGCVIADTPQDFARQIARLLSDANFYSQQVQLAQETFQRYFSLNVNYKKLDRVFHHG